jgi:hypothetical protein
MAENAFQFFSHLDAFHLKNLFSGKNLSEKKLLESPKMS